MTKQLQIWTLKINHCRGYVNGCVTFMTSNDSSVATHKVHTVIVIKIVLLVLQPYRVVYGIIRSP